MVRENIFHCSTTIPDKQVSSGLFLLLLRLRLIEKLTLNSGTIAASTVWLTDTEWGLSIASFLTPPVASYVDVYGETLNAYRPPSSATPLSLVVEHVVGWGADMVNNNNNNKHYY